jgi:hypothetical protein
MPRKKIYTEDEIKQKRNEYILNYRKLNKDKVKEWNIKYRENNQEKLKESRKNYLLKIKMKLQAYDELMEQMKTNGNN